MLKNIFKKKKEEYFQRVNILEYPKQIIVTTLDTLKEGGGVSTDKITSLNKDSDNILLGKTVLKHLELSKGGVSRNENEIGSKFIELTGRKTLKSQMEDSKLVSVNQKDGILIITPSINGGTKGPNRGYRGKKEKIKLEFPIDAEKLGKNIYLSLTMAE